MAKKRKVTARRAKVTTRRAQAPSGDEAEVTARLGQLFPPLPEATPEAAAFFAKAEAERDYSELLESQCGATDDSQPVEQYDGTLGVTIPFVRTHQPMVGQLQWNNNLGSIYTNPGNVSGVRWATGTLISNDLFLTAGHNFDQTGGGWSRPRDNATGAIITPAQIATNMHVNFNYQVDPSGNLRTEQEFPVLALVEYRLGGLDFAIVRLGGNPGSTYGSTTVSTTDAAVGAMICIIGHPAGMPKRIEAGPVTDLHDDRIGYNDIDTLGGNSGSAILRASDGQIVGVHTNGGCTVADPNSDTFHNHGVRITAIIAQSPTLQTLPTPTLKVLDDGGGTLKVVDDGGGTLKAIDDGGGTVKVLDDGPKLKVLDDGPPKRKFVDDGPPKLKILDDGGAGTLKAIDDVKQPALDKQFGDQKLPGSDRPRPPFQPGIWGRLQSVAGARPFVLSTPHHSMAWAQVGTAGVAQLASQYEQTIAQLAQLIQQGSQELAALEQMYQQAIAEYTELMSGSAS